MDIRRFVRHATRAARAALFTVLATTAAARAWAGADTLAVPPPAAPAPTPPDQVASGADGNWYKVPTVSLAPAGPAAQVPREILADIGGRQSHTIVFDPVRARFVAFGGTVQPGGALFNDLWTRTLSATPADWTPLEATGTPPPARSAHSAVYDPIGDRMLVFGGGPPLQNDVWELTLSGTPHWNEIATLGTPPTPRSGHTAVFDVSRNRMLVFGGQTPGLSNETWILDLGSSPPLWQLATTSGTPPAPRVGHVAVLDAARDQMVVYGGTGATFYQDVWALSLGAAPTWTQLGATSLPGRRDGSSAVVDPAGNRMLVYGGRFFTSYYRDLWAFDLATAGWTQITSGAPAGCRSAGFAFDPSSRIAILHGGEPSTLVSAVDTWRIAVSGSPVWTKVAPASLPPPPPPPGGASALRYGAAGLFDAPRHRFLMIGGAFDDRSTLNLLNDIASLTIGADSGWVAVATTFSFTPRYGHNAVYDPARDRVIVFGGYNGSSFLNDLWEIRLAPDVQVGSLTPIGTPPSTRDFPGAIYDPVGDRVLYFGGNHDGIFLNDLWELKLSGAPAWSLLTPAGTAPAPRFCHNAVFDPYGNRMLIFGGYSNSRVSFNDVWSLSLDGTLTWTQLTPAGEPPGPRSSASMQLDTNRRRLVLQGGVRIETGLKYSDLWELPISGGSLRWQQRFPGGVAPVPRYSHFGAIDPATDRMLISGGAGATGTLSDVWRLQWSSDEPTAVSVALLSSHASAEEVTLRWDVSEAREGMCTLERKDAGAEWRAVDEAHVGGSSEITFHDREIVAGARYGYRLVILESDEASRSAEVWVDVPFRAAFSLAGFTPNPAPAGSARVAFSLADRTPATIEVVDVTGRRVASERLEAPSPGAGSIAIAPRAGLAPGLYFVKLTQGGSTLVRRGSVMR